MNQSKFYIHIGLHKTGTTFLQENIFPKLKNIQYINHENFIKSLSTFDNHQANYFMSFEGLSGKLWDRDHNTLSFNKEHRFIESFEKTVNNLKTFFPEAVIIVFFRKHGEFLISIYKQYIKRGGTLSLNEFYKEKGIMQPEDLNYNYRIKLLKKLFNEVHVFDYNDFKKDSVATINHMCGIMNCDWNQSVNKKTSNVGLKGWKIDFTIFYNKVFKKLPIFIKRVLTKLKLEPQSLLQNTLSFLRAKDYDKFKKTSQGINNSFERDWSFVLQHKEIIY
jgi:hypothetical protein